MFFSSYLEFFAILAFTIGFNLVRFLLPGAIHLRKALLLLGSFIIISMIVDGRTLLVLSILMMGVFTVGKVLQKAGSGSSKGRNVLSISLSLIILLFCIRNYPWLSGIFEQLGLAEMVQGISLVGRVGLSYILFRLLHFLVDAYRGKIRSDLNILTFFNYIFFFPTYLSGPIDRYNNFAYWEQQNRRILSSDLILQGGGKIFFGAFKKIILVPVFLPYVNDISLFETVTGVWEWQMMLSVLAYTFYIYFDFSGYSDIAIGSAYLIGIKTPENFDNPYFSKDIRDFWQRWHMSFSSILGEYVFKPFVVGLTARFPSSPRLRISVIGYLYTFIICGLWHGSTLNFVYWGLWHGVGLAIYKMWDKYRPKVEYSNVFSRNLASVTSVSITFIFVAIGWYFFMSSTAEVHNVAKEKISVINSDYAELDETQFRFSPVQVDNRGWGIEVESLMSAGDIKEIQYKSIDEDNWNSLGNNKNLILGEQDFENTSENLASGLYVVRVYSDNGWQGKFVQISNYLKDE